MKILISRTDRAGDVVLTTPLFDALRGVYPNAEIVAHVRKYTEPIIKMNKNCDRIILEKESDSVLALAKQLKHEKFSHAILVHPVFKAMMACFLAQIPVRIGRASNVWQFLLNKRLVQKRSRNEKHEYKYNLDLLLPIVSEINYKTPRLVPDSKALKFGKGYLSQIGLDSKFPVVIHPGHGGSAHNLSIESYVELANMLLSKEIPVLVSLGPTEKNIEKHFANCNSKIFDFIKDIPDFEKLAGIFSYCSLFIGGSTGPMHLAGAVGIPVLAFFPPQKSMTPVRWGPVAETKLVVKPSVTDCCGDCNNCSQYPCMAKIDITTALDWVLKNRKIP